MPKINFLNVILFKSNPIFIIILNNYIYDLYIYILNNIVSI